jgi:hypothetical protein
MELKLVKPLTSCYPINWAQSAIQLTKANSSLLGMYAPISRGSKQASANS